MYLNYFPDENHAPIANGTSRSRENSRRKPSIAATSTSSVASSSNAGRTTANSSVSLDHNYGEPGPTSLRNRRRIVAPSRHQRNPDELDLPVSELTAPMEEDPLRIPENGNISTRLRHRAAASVSNAISSSTGRRRNRVDYDESRDDEEEVVDEEDEDAEEEPVAEEQSDESEQQTDDEDASDPEDDKPLGHLIPSNPTNSRKRQTRSHKIDYNDENEAGPSNQLRSTRTKRPYYNEESGDEEIDVRNRRHAESHQVKRRRGADYAEYEEQETENGNRSFRSRNRPANNHPTNGQNYSEEEESEEDEEPQLSVSSRGRVRKLSNRVKNYFRE